MSDLLWITTVLIRHHVSHVVITWCHVVITDVSCRNHVMSCDLFSHRDAKELVTTKQSKWKQQWQRLRENNPISNGQYHKYLQLIPLPGGVDWKQIHSVIMILNSKILRETASSLVLKADTIPVVTIFNRIEQTIGHPLLLHTIHIPHTHTHHSPHTLTHTTHTLHTKHQCMQHSTTWKWSTMKVTTLSSVPQGW